MEEQDRAGESSKGSPNFLSELQAGPHLWSPKPLLRNISWSVQDASAAWRQVFGDVLLVSEAETFTVLHVVYSSGQGHFGHFAPRKPKCPSGFAEAQEDVRCGEDMTRFLALVSIWKERHDLQVLLDGTASCS